MKTKALLLLVACFFCVLTARAQDAMPGRYLIVSGEHATTGMTGTNVVQLAMKSVFKIDTITGRSWIFVDLNVDGKIVQGWQEITGDVSRFRIPPKIK